MNQATSTKGHLIGYARVSSVDQDAARQLESFSELGLDRTHVDTASGKDTNRPELLKAIDFAREGDTLIVHSLDRLARNLSDLLKIVDSLTVKGIAVRFIKENLTFTKSHADPLSELMLHMLGAFAQFERSLIRERQREGIAIAKKNGAFKGRSFSLKPDKIKEVLAEDTANGGKGRTALAVKYGISRETLYRYIKAA